MVFVELTSACFISAVLMFYSALVSLRAYPGIPLLLLLLITVAFVFGFSWCDDLMQLMLARWLAWLVLLLLLGF